MGDRLGREWKSLKQQLVEKRSKKLRLEARRFLSREGGADVVFSKQKNKPSATQFEEMCVSAKFGPGDPLFAGGGAFALDYLMDENADELGHSSEGFFNHSGKLAASTSNAPDAEFNAKLWQFSTPHIWGNVFVQCVVPMVMIGHARGLNSEDFDWDPSKGIYVDRVSRSFGIRVLISPFQPISEMQVAPDSGRNPSQFKSNDTFCVYTVQLGVAEQFDDVEEAELHGVQGHNRNLGSGKVVQVRAHARHNPTRGMSRKLNHGEIRHVVYRAYDLDGMLRYIGEGLEGRPQHVNSGTSHNFKLNEHFFLRGPMRVELLELGLSKSEALAIECLEIRRCAGADLWNIRENSSTDWVNN